MNELTVWSVCIGNKYNPAYVYALKEMVERNLTIPHTFRCITTEKLEGINCVRPFGPWQSWWSKINLFTPRMATGPSIYFDLDTVIVGNIDYLADYTDTFSAPANWAQSGYGGIQSSVMCWSGNWTLPYEKFNYQRDQAKFHGDQEYLWDLLGDNWVRVPHVGSYKYHCRDGLDPDLRVVAFHGRPDPHEVNDKWILSATSIHTYLTNGSMVNGLKRDSSATA